MNDLTSMYDEASDLDTRLESASHMLKEAADQAGFDLNKLSADELSNLLTDMIQGTPDNDNAKVAEQEQSTEVEGPTVGAISFELTKRAAAEGLDLSKLQPAEYQELLDKVAAEMLNPELAEEAQKLAEQEATMDHLGRVAARGFVDEVNKLAADDEDAKKDKKEDEADDEDDKKKMASAKQRAKAAFVSANGGQKHASLEAAATKLARETLLANGIDPDTGTKIASDVAVQVRAREMLQEAGYAV